MVRKELERDGSGQAERSEGHGLGEGPSPSLPTGVALRGLLLLAGPIAAARASQAIGGFADALMIAPLGEVPLAAVTTGWLNLYIATILPVTTVYILQSFTAQLRGRGDLEAVHRYAWYGLGIALASQLLAFALLPLLPSVLGLAPFEPAVRDQLATYLAIRTLSVGPLVAIEALGSWYGGLGDTRPAMISGIATLLVSVLGNYLLIPQYGTAGVAWASVIGTFAGLTVIAVPYALGWGAPARPARLGLRAQEFLRVLKFGVPHGTAWFLEAAAFLFFINGVAAHLGTGPLAAFNVVLQLNSLAFLPTLGLAVGGAIVAGEAIGRRSFGEARRLTGLALATSVAWMASMGVFYLVAPAPLINLFAYGEDGGAAFIATGVVMLRFFAVSQLFDAVGLVLHQVLRAAGDTTWCMLARSAVSWFIFVPVAWLLVIQEGGGVVVAMSVVLGYIALLAGTVALRFRGERWESIELMGEPELV